MLTQYYVMFFKNFNIPFFIQAMIYNKLALQNLTAHLLCQFCCFLLSNVLLIKHIRVSNTNNKENDLQIIFL